MATEPQKASKTAISAFRLLLWTDPPPENKSSSYGNGRHQMWSDDSEWLNAEIEPSYDLAADELIIRIKPKRQSPRVTS